MPLNAIVDLSHHNTDVDLEAAKAAGLLGVIHKATQGLKFTDPMFAARKQQAASAGLLWGAYHFGVGSDGVEQAKFFLDTAGANTDQLLVLDFELNTSGGQSMTLQQARDFVTYIHQHTGRWPGFYCGGYFKKMLSNKVDSLIKNCWLWLAQYTAKPTIPASWKTWTMWQYTDGKYGPLPHEIQGIGACDRDQFNGSAADLQTFWPTTAGANAAIAG